MPMSQEQSQGQRCEGVETKKELTFSMIIYSKDYEDIPAKHH